MSHEPYETPQAPLVQPAKRGLSCWTIGTLIGCAVPIFLTATCGGFLAISKRSADRAISEYFARIERQSAGQIEQDFRQELKDSPSSGQIARFLKTLVERAGPFEGLAVLGFDVSSHAVNGRTEGEYGGTYRFGQREVTMRLAFFDGRLSGFAIEDPTPVMDVLEAISTVPDDRRRYRDRAELILETLIQGDTTAAWEALSQEAREDLDRRGLEDWAAHYEGKGELSDFRYEAETVDPDDPRLLRVSYLGRLGNEPHRFGVTYRFVGLAVIFAGLSGDPVEEKP